MGLGRADDMVLFAKMANEAGLYYLSLDNVTRFSGVASYSRAGILAMNSRPGRNGQPDAASRSGLDQRCFCITMRIFASSGLAAPL